MTLAELMGVVNDLGLHAGRSPFIPKLRGGCTEGVSEGAMPAGRPCAVSSDACPQSRGLSRQGGVRSPLTLGSPKPEVHSLSETHPGCPVLPSELRSLLFAWKPVKEEAPESLLHTGPFPLLPAPTPKLWELFPCARAGRPGGSLGHGPPAEWW